MLFPIICCGWVVIIYGGPNLNTRRNVKNKQYYLYFYFPIYV